MARQAITRKSWTEFKDSRLLWWVNRSLHLFGWAIVLELDASGAVTDAYPARVVFRGFDAQDESNGFVGLTTYLEQNAHDLRLEAEQE